MDFGKGIGPKPDECGGGGGGGPGGGGTPASSSSHAASMLGQVGKTTVAVSQSDKDNGKFSSVAAGDTTLRGGVGEVRR